MQSYIREINKLKKSLIADIKVVLMYHLKNDTVGFNDQYLYAFTKNQKYIRKTFSKREFAITNSFHGFHSNGIILDMYNHGFKVISYEDLSVDDLHDALVFAKKYFKNK